MSKLIERLYIDHSSAVELTIMGEGDSMMVYKFPHENFACYVRADLYEARVNAIAAAEVAMKYQRGVITELEAEVEKLKQTLKYREDQDEGMRELLAENAQLKGALNAYKAQSMLCTGKCFSHPFNSGEQTDE